MCSSLSSQPAQTGKSDVGVDRNEVLPLGACRKSYLLARVKYYLDA